MNNFSDWITKGAGEGILGRIIRNGALREKRRLRNVLNGGGLFPHIDHETKDRIAKCEDAAQYGQQKIQRHARRSETIEKLVTDSSSMTEKK